MLDEVQLLVPGRRPEVVAQIGQVLVRLAAPSSAMIVMTTSLPKGGLVSTIWNLSSMERPRASSTCDGLGRHWHA